MMDRDKTKEQLIKELEEARQRIAELDRFGAEHWRFEEALRESEARYRAFFDRTLYCVFIHDFQGRFLDANKAALDLLGYRREEIPLLNLSLLLDTDQLHKALEILEEVKSTGSQKYHVEYRLRRKNGEYVWVETEASVIYREGKPYAIQGIARDITKRKKMEEELHALSLIDELTGLYNRRGFLTLAQQQLKIADRLKKDLFLLFSDLDGLKGINDTFGHHEGDRALIDTARILKGTFRESDIIARIGGDEFVVLTIGISEESVEVLRRRLKKNLAKYEAQERRPYRLSISTGMAHYNPRHPCSIDELMERADKLMYEEKRHKHSF
ncbi:MAG: diguanylate cyclase [Nitrospira sp.]|nr:diguanylate cyclase [Nitrospira sp.]